MSCVTFCLVKLAFVKFLCNTFVEWNDATLNDFEQPDGVQHFETTFFRSDVWHNLANLDAMTYVETQSKCRDETIFSFILNLFKIQGKLSLVSNLTFQNNYQRFCYYLRTKPSTKMKYLVNKEKKLPIFCSIMFTVGFVNTSSTFFEMGVEGGPPVSKELSLRQPRVILVNLQY